MRAVSFFKLYYFFVTRNRMDDGDEEDDVMTHDNGMGDGIDFVCVRETLGLGLGSERRWSEVTKPRCLFVFILEHGTCIHV